MSWWSKTWLGQVMSGRWNSAVKSFDASIGFGQTDKQKAAAEEVVKPPTITPEMSVLSPQEEMDKLVQQRMARLGKYFTSPTGVLSGASTGSQKVFS